MNADKVNSKNLNAKDAKGTRRTRRKPEQEIFSNLISLFLGAHGVLGGERIFVFDRRLSAFICG
jgi:hypothetical protein